MAKSQTIYSINKSILSDLDLLIDPAIPETTRFLIKVIIRLCKESIHSEEKLSFQGLTQIHEQLQKEEINISKGRVSQIMTTLKKTGGVTEENFLDPSLKRRRKRIQLVDIKKIQVYFRDIKDSKKQKSLGGRLKNVVFNEATSFVSAMDKGVHLTLDGETHNRMDQLFCIIDAAMKSSKHDKRKIITVNYHFAKNDWIEITSVTTTGINDDIAHLSDQRAMRIINGYYTDKIKDDIETFGVDYEPDGYLSFDINSLCVRMGMTPDNQTKAVARNMLHRLSSTEYRINAKNSKFFRGNFGWDTGKIRYLTESIAISELENIDENHALFEMKERFYRVRLHGDIVDSLMSMAFISHPKLAKEKSGLAHRLSNWSKAVIGVRPVTDKNLAYTLDQFHERVYPATPFSNFKRDLFKLLLREYTGEWREEEGFGMVVKIYGYFYKVLYSQEQYTLLIKKEKRGLKRNAKPIVIIPTRDPDDLYVGDNSDHNKALRSVLSS